MSVGHCFDQQKKYIHKYIHTTHQQHIHTNYASMLYHTHTAAVGGAAAAAMARVGSVGSNMQGQGQGQEEEGGSYDDELYGLHRVVMVRACAFC